MGITTTLLLQPESLGIPKTQTERRGKGNAPPGMGLMRQKQLVYKLWIDLH